MAVIPEVADSPTDQSEIAVSGRRRSAKDLVALSAGIYCRWAGLEDRMDGQPPAKESWCQTERLMPWHFQMLYLHVQIFPDGECYYVYRII